MVGTHRSTSLLTRLPYLLAGKKMQIPQKNQWLHRKSVPMQRWMVLFFCTRCAWARPLRWLLWALLALCCLAVRAATGVGASTSTSAPPDRPARNWADPAPVLPLTTMVRYFKEMPGQPLDWQQALSSPRWQPPNAQDMAALHGESTLWLQLVVENSGPKPVTRLVALDSWLLNDVQLWMLEVDGRNLLEHQHSGQALAPQDRAVDSEVPTFSITLAPGQRVRLLLRMSDLYWSDVKLTAWESAAFVRAQMRPKLGFMAVSGAALALCVVLLLMRHKLLAITSVWVLLSLLLELTFAGLVSEFALPAKDFSPALLMLAVGWLTSCASAFVTMYFMGLEHHPFWYRWNWGMVVLALVLIWLMQGSHSYLERQGMLLFTVAQVLSNMFMLAWVQLRGYPWRQWMVALMVVNFVVAVGRVALRQFYVEPETYELLMNAVLTIKGMRVLMVIGLVALQRNSETYQVRQRLQAAEHKQRQDLQAAVEQRTVELRQALVAAKEANHAKTDFLARVSHDLRSPLTSISGYAQLLQRMGGRTAQLAQTIRRSAEHMQTMVNDLIDYARGDTSEQPESQSVYIHALLDDVAIEATALAARHNNRFELRLETELPPVLLLDAKRVRRMLANLLENASKFTHHGTVALTVSTQPPGAQPLQLCLAVSDTGVGIALSDQQRLFEPFFRGTNAKGTQGMGLGLSIVSVWAQRLGGVVQVHSVPGEGTTFTLRLPVAVGAETEVTTHLQLGDAAHLPPLDGGGRCVWVVEDNADIRELLAQELGATGFVVKTSHDGTDFIARMKNAGTEIPHLVLTDYLMPGADGSDVLQAVRTHWPGVPVVLLSATQKTMQSLGVARDSGFDASLMKPLNLADLRITLAEILHLPRTSDGLEMPNSGLPTLDGHATAVPGAAQAAGTVFPRCLTVDELERVCLWVEMGALTDLTEWAERLVQHRPECAEFAGRLLTLLAAARLNEVQALCHAATQEQKYD